MTKQQAGRVMQELLNSEREYFTDLGMLQRLYVKPLSEGVKTKGFFLTERDLGDLFSNFDDIFKLNLDLLRFVVCDVCCRCFYFGQTDIWKWSQRKKKSRWTQDSCFWTLPTSFKCMQCKLLLCFVCRLFFTVLFCFGKVLCECERGEKANGESCGDEQAVCGVLREDARAQRAQGARHWLVPHQAAAETVPVPAAAQRTAGSAARPAKRAVCQAAAGPQSHVSHRRNSEQHAQEHPKGVSFLSKAVCLKFNKKKHKAQRVTAAVGLAVV
jgi:hypothetical protein